MSNDRLIGVDIDDETLGASGPDAEHERRVAIFDLLESNSFKVIAPAEDGPMAFANIPTPPLWFKSPRRNSRGLALKRLVVATFARAYPSIIGRTLNWGFTRRRVVFLDLRRAMESTFRVPRSVGGL